MAVSHGIRIISATLPSGGVMALSCISAGSLLPALGSILMTALIIKVSGVALLEKNLADKKPGYRKYIENTSAFFPWFPKK